MDGLNSRVCVFFFFLLVWMDNRTKVTIKEFLSTKADKSTEQLKELCGLPISPYFSALKYLWLIDNVPEVREAIQEERCLFGTIDSWIIWVSARGSELYNRILFNISFYNRIWRAVPEPVFIWLMLQMLLVPCSWI